MPLSDRPTDAADRHRAAAAAALVEVMQSVPQRCLSAHHRCHDAYDNYGQCSLSTVNCCTLVSSPDDGISTALLEYIQTQQMTSGMHNRHSRVQLLLVL